MLEDLCLNKNLSLFVFIQRHNDTRNNVNRMLLKYSVIWPPVDWKARQQWGALCSSCSTAWLVSPTKSCTHYIIDTWNCDEQRCLYTERNFTARITSLQVQLIFVLLPKHGWFLHTSDGASLRCRWRLGPKRIYKSISDALVWGPTHSMSLQCLG